MNNVINATVAATSFPQKHTLNKLYSFFCWCSGARLYILEKCPTDYNTFFGIGIIVFITGLLASLSGGYAFYTIFKNQYIAVFLGLFWGILIFFLDWYLVASLKKEKKKYKEIAIALPRFVLAVFLGIIISYPVELKLFDKEIQKAMTTMNIKETVGQQNLINKQFEEID
ncbi:MAG: DUF4407 domain-containing protein, partial [Bacteroidales bacterium]